MAGGYEEYLALLEAARNGACDAYFRANPLIDDPVMHKIFEHGFARGYRAGHDRAAPDPGSVPIPTSVQQAQLMANLGLDYLLRHAPEKLKFPASSPAPERAAHDTTKEGASHG